MSFILVADNLKATVSYSTLLKSSQLVRDYVALVSSNHDDSDQPQMVLPANYKEMLVNYVYFLACEGQYGNLLAITTTTTDLTSSTVISEELSVVKDDDDGRDCYIDRRHKRKNNNKKKRTRSLAWKNNTAVAAPTNKDVITSQLSKKKINLYNLYTIDSHLDFQQIIKHLELADYLQADNYFEWCLEHHLFRRWSHHVDELYKSNISSPILEQIVICLPYVFLPVSYQQDMAFMVRWVDHNMCKSVMFEGGYCHHIIATKYVSDDKIPFETLLSSGRDVWLAGYSANYSAPGDKFTDHHVEFIYNPSLTPPIRQLTIYGSE